MSRKHEVGVGLLLLSAIGLLAWLSLKIGGGAMWSKRVDVSAVFDDAAGLQEGAAVTVAGVEVGQVSGLQVDFNTAVVGLSLDPDAQIRSDVVVAIRARSVLGEKYVELLPQTQDAPPLQGGEVLTQTIGTTEIDELVNDLGPLVSGLDQDALAQALGPMLEGLRSDPEQLARMLDDTEVLLHNLRLASEDAPALVDESRQAVAEARTTLRDVRVTVDQIDPLLTRTDDLLTQVEGVVGQVEGSTEDLPALLAETQATMQETHALMATMNANSASLVTILGNLEELDTDELQRLMREEGVRVRLLPGARD